jgi:gas vesicle protein GvpL/GvpF
VQADDLCLLWSEVEWPFESASIQQSAREFHGVVSHVFSQTAVIPFRLLTVFESEQSLAGFAAEHRSEFVADLRRLKNTMQMECIVFFKTSNNHPEASSGRDYLSQKAMLQGEVREYAETVAASLSQSAREVRAEEVNNGKRIYCLLERGQEQAFRSCVEAIAVPPGLERRTSGPWPPAEFLSDPVKMPQIAGKK